MRAHRHSSNTTTRVHSTVVLGALALSLFIVTKAEASTPTVPGFASISVPLIAHLETETNLEQQQEEERRDPPPVIDPASGPVLSVFGGTVFSGKSAFQTGGAIAYFFGAKAGVGLEAEASMILGPGGIVTQVMGSFILQAGARTSKFVPYIALGGGFLQATTKFPDEKAEALEKLGINPEPTKESAPFVHIGGGLRFYIKRNLAFRGDVRVARVKLDLEGVDLIDSLFRMRRVVGMLSWEF
ncbi:MAG: hypothetical protein QF680_06190 [Acidobacteriota bacterium]|nr:hypothetical protein [Acidobacteriota bacterium]